MKVITATEARKIVTNYIPKELKDTLNFVMNEIKENAENGHTCVEFDDFYSICDYERIKSKKFKEYIESFGYTHEVIAEEKCGEHSERVKISW